MIQVNKLCQMCNEMLNVVSHEESLSGGLAEVSVEQLNLLISELNSQGYVSLAQNYIDFHNSRVVEFKRLVDGESNPGNVIDMEAPESIDGVSRKIGVTYMPLNSIDLQQMSQRNPMTLARSWNYGRHYEQIPGDPDGAQRAVGVLQLDGQCQQGMRIFVTDKLQTYTLDDTIYLPDLYNNMLVQGLCVKLCEWHKLNDAKPDYVTNFNAAKALIKRNNITQRMMQSGPMGRSYRDDFEDGVAGQGW